jgi:hypothetical protein
LNLLGVPQEFEHKRNDEILAHLQQKRISNMSKSAVGGKR